MNDAIRHLDQRFRSLRPLFDDRRPPKGWVRAIRNALGMTTKQLAQRMGVAQPRIIELEKAEVSSNITLHSLERAAEALGCHVVYALVPEHSLAYLVEKQAKHVADQTLGVVEQTMKLEDQAVSDLKAHKGMQQQLIDELLRKPARLWDTK
jgi:predicted DNA-binding mobile mystery protein A